MILSNTAHNLPQRIDSGRIRHLTSVDVFKLLLHIFQATNQADRPTAQTETRINDQVQHAQTAEHTNQIGNDVTATIRYQRANFVRE